MGSICVGVVWECILISVWLRGKIRVGEWCCEVVGSCEVQQVVRWGVLLSHNLIKTCMCVCVCVCLCLDPSWPVAYTSKQSSLSELWLWWYWRPAQCSAGICCSQSWDWILSGLYIVQMLSYTCMSAVLHVSRAAEASLLFSIVCPCLSVRPSVRPSVIVGFCWA